MLLSVSLYRISSLDHRLSSEYLRQVILLMKGKTSLIPSIPAEAPYFWKEPDLNNSNKQSSDDDQGGRQVILMLIFIFLILSVLSSLCKFLEAVQFTTADDLSVLMKQFALKESLSYGRLMSLCRWALTGGMVGCLK